MDQSDFDTDEKSRPQRLDETTASYLTALETQLVASAGEGMDESEREVLVENVLSELQHSTASAACDRRTNILMEKLCYASSLPQLLDIMTRFTMYGVFLARNRHSSHVLQAMLARLCYLLKFVGLGEVEEDVARDIVLAFVTPVLNEVTWLAKEINATHVVRSIFCMLAGVPVITERKGKGSKHQHSVSLSEPIENIVEPGRFFVSKSVCFDVPEEFHGMCM